MAHGAALISVSIALSQTPAKTASKFMNTGLVCRVVCPFSSQLTPVPIYTAWWTEAHVCVNNLPPRYQKITEKVVGDFRGGLESVRDFGTKHRLYFECDQDVDPNCWALLNLTRTNLWLFVTWYFQTSKATQRGYLSVYSSQWRWTFSRSSMRVCV